MSQANNLLKDLLNILCDVIYEDVNPYDLHEKELEEIMLNIYGAFWNPTIEGYYYPSMLTDEQEEEELKEYNLENGLKDAEQKTMSDFQVDMLYTKIPIKSLGTKPIDKDFKEPIYCKSEQDKLELWIRLPRVGDALIAQDFVEKLYAAQEQIYKKEGVISYGHPKYEEYAKYQSERTMDYGVAVTAQCLIKINGTITKENGEIVTYDNATILHNLEEQMEIYKRIPRSFWNYCFSELRKHEDSFGIDPEVEVVSPITKKLVERRARFQLMELIPSGEVQATTGYVSRYGD